MDSRTRVITAMRRQIPDRVPVDLSWGLSPGILETFRHKTGASDPDEYFKTDVRFVGLEIARGFGSILTDDDFDPDWEKKEVEFRKLLGNDPAIQSVTEWGTGHIPGSEHHFTRIVCPLLQARTPVEIQSFPFPAFDETWRLRKAQRQIEKFHKQGLCVAGSAACSIFEVSWQLRGMEQLLEDFIQHPEMATVLLDKVTQIRADYVRSLVNMGIDLIVLGDDIATQIGMMMSPALWRRWLKPRLGQIIQAARAIVPDLLVFYHSDGNPSAVIPDLIEIGVDILNPVQPECMDPVALKKKYGDQLAFWGTIGTQTTFPYGRPEIIREVVKERMETVGKGGGLLLGPTHMLEPDVPWENIVAFFESIEEFGYY